MKIFEAEMSDGEITANGGKVTGCPVLGQGGDSKGYLIMAEDKLVYLPKTSPDLDKTLELLSTALNIIATNIFQRNGGGDITTQTFSTELALLKNQVDELKGKLR